MPPVERTLRPGEKPGARLRLLKPSVARATAGGRGLKATPLPGTEQQGTRKPDSRTPLALEHHTVTSEPVTAPPFRARAGGVTVNVVP